MASPVLIVHVCRTEHTRMQCCPDHGQTFSGRRALSGKMWHRENTRRTVANQGSQKRKKKKSQSRLAVRQGTISECDVSRGVEASTRRMRRIPLEAVLDEILI